MRPTALIGTFDGVHRRSSEFIGHARDSSPANSPVVAVVFRVVGATYLTNAERTCELLVQQGADTAHAVAIDQTGGLGIVHRFLAELAPTSARLDRDLEPDVTLLVRAALDRERVPLQRSATTSLDTGPASMIHRAVRIGDIALANRWLGRPHRITVSLNPAESGTHVATCLDPGCQRPTSGIFLAVVATAGRSYRAELSVVGPDTFVLAFNGAAPPPDAAVASIDFLDRASGGIARAHALRRRSMNAPLQKNVASASRP